MTPRPQFMLDVCHLTCYHFAFDVTKGPCTMPPKETLFKHITIQQ